MDVGPRNTYTYKMLFYNFTMLIWNKSQDSSIKSNLNRTLEHSTATDTMMTYELAAKHLGKILIFNIEHLT